MFDDMTPSTTSYSLQPFLDYERHLVQLLGHNFRVALTELYNDATRGAGDTNNRNKALRQRLMGIPRWSNDLVVRETRLIQKAIPDFDTLLTALIVDKTRSFADGVFEVYGPQNILDSCTISVPPISTSKFVHSVFSMLSMRFLSNPTLLESDYDKATEILESSIRQVVNQYVPYASCASCMLKSQRTGASATGGVELSRWKNVVGDQSDPVSVSHSPFNQTMNEEVIREGSDIPDETIVLNDLPEGLPNPQPLLSGSADQVPAAVPLNHGAAAPGAGELGTEPLSTSQTQNFQLSERGVPTGVPTRSASEPVKVRTARPVKRV